MLTLFKTHSFINLVLFVCITIALSIGIFMDFELYTSDKYDNLALHLLSINTHFFYQYALYIASLLSIGILSNVIANRHKLYTRPNAFVLLLISSLITLATFTHTLHPSMIATIFIVIAWYNIMLLYGERDTHVLIFNTGFFVGVASLFYTPYIVFILICFLNIQNLSSITLQKTFQYAVSLLLPFFFLGVYHYWSGIPFYIGKAPDFYQYMERFTVMLSGLKLSYVVGFVVIIFFVLFIILSYTSLYTSKPISIKKKIDALFWWLIGAIASIVIWGDWQPFSLVSIIVPLSLLISIFLSDQKSILIAEFFIFLILLCIGIQQYTTL